MFGDVNGNGIPHKKEWKLNSIEQCAIECNHVSQCNSFVFGHWGSLYKPHCKLMNDIMPIDPPLETMTFCVKCKYLVLSLFFNLI